MLRKVWTVLELSASILGFVLLFGPPTWQQANLRAIFTVLGIVVVFAGVFGVVMLWPQSKKPYEWGE